MSVKKLKEYLDMTNIAEDFDEEKLHSIAQKVKYSFDEDSSSMSDWLSDVKKVLELASLKAKPKNYPLPQSANIKYPLITKAAYEFSSRTYPEIIRDGKLVKSRIIGVDYTGEKALQAKRVEDYMNYQLLFANETWECELDKMLTMMALIGFVCRKTYYDPIKEQVTSEICNHEDLIINSKAQSMNTAQRVSHVLHLSLNDLMEHVRSGVYLEEPVKDLVMQHSADDVKPVIDIIEQHCFMDLDEDDYEEPYVITILKDECKVLRIAPRFTEEDIKSKKNQVIRITPINYFTDYHFLTSPKGDLQSVGFGILMLHLTETINTLLNQIADAGQLANLQGGYVDSRAKMIESGQSLHDPGELKKVKIGPEMNLRDAFHMINFKEPSAVLFQTLGLLIQSTRDLSSTMDVLTGSASTENIKTGAVMALQEEGRKVFTSIQRRIYRSLTSEYRKIFKLNKIYLDPSVYVEVLDDELAISQTDFDETKVNIIPVADPNLATRTSKLAEAQFLLTAAAMPGAKPEAITRRVFETLIDNPQELLMSEEDMEQAKQQPNPEVIKLQAEIESNAQELNIKGRELELEERRFALETYKTECEITKLKTDALLNLAKAEAEEAGTQLDSYKMYLDHIQAQVKNLIDSKPDAGVNPAPEAPTDEY